VTSSADIPPVRKKRRFRVGLSIGVIVFAFTWLIKLVLVGGAGPLHIAAMCKANTIARALSPVVDVNAATGAGVLLSRINNCTPLHIAATTANSDLVKTLIANGASVNDETANYQTPLFLAIESQCADCVRSLLDAGASVVATRSDRIPLHEALRRGDEGTIDALLLAGADPNEADESGNSAWMYAGYRSNDPSQRSRIEHMLREHGMIETR